MIDIKGKSAFTQVATPAARTATLTGTGFDVSAYNGNITFVQNVGVVSGTNPTWAGTIEDSANDSDYTAVSGAAFTSVTSSTNLQTLNVDTRSVRKYLRYVGTIGGTSTPTFNVSVTAIGEKQAVG